MLLKRNFTAAIFKRMIISLWNYYVTINNKLRYTCMLNYWRYPPAVKMRQKIVIVKTHIDR